jgi:hypothetical protein
MLALQLLLAKRSFFLSQFFQLIRQHRQACRNFKFFSLDAIGHIDRHFQRFDRRAQCVASVVLAILPKPFLCGRPGNFAGGDLKPLISVIL